MEKNLVKVEMKLLITHTFDDGEVYDTEYTDDIQTYQIELIRDNSNKLVGKTFTINVRDNVSKTAKLNKDDEYILIHKALREGKQVQRATDIADELFGRIERQIYGTNAR